MGSIGESADRYSAAKIGLGEKIMFEARLFAAQELIHCYVACDDIGGLILERSSRAAR